MKPKRVTIICILVILMNLLALGLLRTVPVTRIWSGYSVLYADRSLPESTVLDALRRSGCTDVISLSLQRAPFSADIIPPESALGSQYLSSRLSYFFDRDSRYELYYIPKKDMARAAKAVGYLIKNGGATAALDGRQRYPWIVAVLSFAVFAALLVFSTHKKVFLICAVFFPLMTVSLPFYPVASSCVLAMVCVFISERLWLRRDALHALIKNPYAVSLAAGSIVLGAAYSWRSAVLVILASASSACSLILLHERQSCKDSGGSFTFVSIIPARSISLVHQGNISLLQYASGLMALLLLLFLFSARLNKSSYVSQISLPCPVSSRNAGLTAGEELPVLEDYFQWLWEAGTFPYRSLNYREEHRPAEEGETLLFERYENGPGGISVSQSLILQYNESFRAQAERQISALDYPAIEKLMQRQGRGLHVAYSRRGAVRMRADSWALVLMILSVLLPAALCAYYYVFGRGGYENSK